MKRSQFQIPLCSLDESVCILNKYVIIISSRSIYLKLLNFFRGEEESGDENRET